MNEAEKKADEIIESYKEYANYNVIQWDAENPITDLLENQKQCALIHVNGKLKPTFIKGKRYDITLIEILFWQEVKTIIENK